MGLGTEGAVSGVSAGAEGTTGLSALGALSSTGGGNVAATGGGSAGVIAGLQNFLKDPKNQQLLGTLMKQVGSLKATATKLPPDAQKMFTAMMAHGFSSAAGLGTPGSPEIGAIAPTQGPYTGDAPNYAVNPGIANEVLRRMGIPGGGY
jgi:hypothetical protein